MGKDTVQFACHHCGHCCTEVVCLPTPWDVIRIVKETGESPERFLEFIGPNDISGVNKSDPTWLECNGKRALMALRRGEKGCHFLDKRTRHCRIYNSRPILCRLYPFCLHESRQGEYKGFTLHKEVGCPKNQDGTVDAHPLYLLYLQDKGHQEAYGDLVEVFNRDKSPGKRFEDFIKLFVVDNRRTKSGARSTKL